MGGKLSPVIIAVLVIVVVALGVLMFNIIASDDPVVEPGGPTTGDSESEVILNLSKEIDEKNSNKYIITAYATTTDPDGVQEIILPDGNSVAGDVANYIVAKNGTYSFQAICVNGEFVSSEISVTEIQEVSATNPYVPAGFEVLNQNVDEGFVIEDKAGNQFVWVPVPTGKMTRNTIFSVEYEESNSTASALVNSVANNYGFYIGRFEASQYQLDGRIVASSMSGKIPWTNLTYQDANDYSVKAAEAFGYTDCDTALMNSFAWDTTLEWIDQSITNYSSVTNYGNYSGTIYPTGTTQTDVVKNISDLAGNVREWTTEIFKGTNGASAIHRVVRGGSANLSRTPGSHTGYSEETSGTYWGFRLILYKK